jgi:hypothetical protein
VRREEKGELGGELVDIQSGIERCLHVIDPVGKREGEFLCGRGSGLADVIARNRDRVELRGLRRTELEDIRDDPHRRLRRVDVRIASDVFFQHVVLDGSPQLRAIDTLLVTDGDIHRQQDRSRRVDRHTGGDFIKRNALEDSLHIPQ